VRGYTNTLQRKLVGAWPFIGTSTSRQGFRINMAFPPRIGDSVPIQYRQWPSMDRQKTYVH